jgi:hypothetical protein
LSDVTTDGLAGSAAIALLILGTIKSAAWAAAALRARDPNSGGEHDFRRSHAVPDWFVHGLFTTYPQWTPE